MSRSSEEAMSAVHRRVRVVEALPEIVEHLEPEQKEIARRQLVADLVVAKTGSWRPQVPTNRPGHLGLLVLEGLLSRDVILEKPLATELVGQGDLLRPSDRDGEDAPIPFGVSWTVLEPARFAVLDPTFARTLGQWPSAVEAVLRGASNRAHSLAITLAVSNLRRVDVRLLVLLWYLADRWGRVTPDGVIVPLRLTHETLARLVGAQRPSVTTAIRQLEAEDRLRRTRDRLWLLCGDPPETLARRTAVTVGE
jgi:CRP/FNR family transcriptional regulator, cyclic AMP receptor protein